MLKGRGSSIRSDAATRTHTHSLRYSTRRCYFPCMCWKLYNRYIILNFLLLKSLVQISWLLASKNNNDPITQLSICPFWCQHLYGTLFEPFLCNGAQSALWTNLHYIWCKFRRCFKSPTGQLTDKISNGLRGRRGRISFLLELKCLF